MQQSLALIGRYLTGNAMINARSSLGKHSHGAADWLFHVHGITPWARKAISGVGLPSELGFDIAAMGSTWQMTVRTYRAPRKQSICARG